MKINRFLHIPLLMFVVFLLMGITTERFVLKGGIKQNDIRWVTKNLHKQLDEIDRQMNQVADQLNHADSSNGLNFFDLLQQTNHLFEEKELSIMISSNDELIYWSDHIVGYFDEIIDAVEGLVQMPNGWYVLSRKKTGNYVIHGLTLIKYNYQLQNEYLNDGFAKAFHLPNDFKVNFYNTETTYPIYDQQNSFLFSIEPSEFLPCIYSDLYFPLTLYCLALLALFIVLYRLMAHYYHRYPASKLILLLLLLIGFYLILTAAEIPRSVFLLDIFSPKYFAYSSYWGSLGEYLVFTIFILFWSMAFSRTFDIKTISKLPTTVRLGIWLVFLAALFVLIRFMILTLIMNSSISFSIFHIEEISFYSVLGFLSIGFLLLAFFFISIRIARVFYKKVSLLTFLIMLSAITLVISALLIQFDPSEKLRLNLFMWVIVMTAFWSNMSKVFKHRLSLTVLFVFIFSVFSVITLIKFQIKNEKNKQELFAMNLSVEHDPMAELFLRDIDLQLKNDTVIGKLLVPPYEMAEEYLLRKYFGGYLREYDLQFTICQSSDSVIIQPENKLQACMPFFEQMIDKNGIEIQGINFSFLDNMNGRITYIGKYNFDLFGQSLNGTMFIELNSKLLSEGTGFPELLLPAHSIENRLKSNFSFAKYNKGELVDRGGAFLYALTTKAYQLPDEKIGWTQWNGYEHFFYQLGNNNFVIVSREKTRLSDYLITFPYIFVFLFILFVAITFVNKPFLKVMPINSSLRMRIQLSIIGVVFGALMVVGGGTVLYNIAQYRNNHQKNLIDKINSVSVEIEMLVEDATYLDDQLIDFLGFELMRISDIFWTDVNVYDLKGALVATSRPEVFEKGLISTRMNNKALYQLSKFEPTRYLHQEHIAKMEYLSAYVPLINQYGQSIGYINIPYFTKQKEFRNEVATFILAFINIYVFLLLISIMVAYYIATRITFPLKLIRENLRVMQLGKETMPIEYKSDDEIGLLVSEYNNKLEELAYSAELLARSERETAWREMAKQIAHEIKNPLTPMKLNIQFLQRSKPSNMENYDEMVKRVTEAIIEQIDNLSAIATEFSNFAQIPRAHNEKFNLTERLSEIIRLYNYTGQVDIVTHFKPSNNLWVFADKEQFSRAILNLIKNSIQAIPENRKGVIDIRIEKNNGKMACIIIEDNGKGIPDSLTESIFVPNFTTKSSGTGLGLAIARNIVENFKGKIWFESKVDAGTKFYINIPLIKENV